MSPLLTLIAWVGTKIRAWRAREPVAQLEESGNALAQLQDHGGRAARGHTASPNAPIPIAEQVDPERDDGSGGYRVLVEPRIDGGTCWRLASASGRPWLCWRALRRAAESGEPVVEVVDALGEVFEYELDRGRPGSGSLELRSGSTRLDVKRTQATITITAQTAEVEGVSEWMGRELPRLVGWLVGTEDELGLGELGELGLRLHRIEQCCDIEGLAVTPVTAMGMVSAGKKWSEWLTDGAGRQGFGAGRRKSTPSSIGVYDKPGELGRQRGPDHRALLEAWKVAGWVEGRPVARIELRSMGEALKMITSGGEALDLSDPLAVLDDRLMALLWADGLTRHWLALPRQSYFDRLASGEEPRVRDEPMHPAWGVARAAVGRGAGPVRLLRDQQARQRQAVEDHARGRLARAGADVEELAGGDGHGEAARAALEDAIAASTWPGLVARARARYRDLG